MRHVGMAISTTDMIIDLLVLYCSLEMKNSFRIRADSLRLQFPFHERFHSTSEHPVDSLMEVKHVDGGAAISF